MISLLTLGSYKESSSRRLIHGDNPVCRMEPISFRRSKMALDVCCVVHRHNNWQHSRSKNFIFFFKKKTKKENLIFLISFNNLDPAISLVLSLGWKSGITSDNGGFVSKVTGHLLHGAYIKRLSHDCGRA